MGYSIGVDVGGTFTDCVVISPDGSIATGKSLSIPDDFSEGVINSIKVAIESLGEKPHKILPQTDYFCHGTTVAENALLTRTGAKAGLITTRGFEDTILIMRGKGRIAGLGEEAITHPVMTDKPIPLIPRKLIEGVLERVDYKGRVLTPISKREVSTAIDRLKKQKVNAIAICLLWSFKNSSHERFVKETIHQMDPSIFVTTSSDLVPVEGEYERTATTAINAYAGPVFSSYLGALTRKLRKNGFKKQLLVMQAYGGVLPASVAVERSVGVIESGPVAGVIASQFLASKLGYQNVIAADMGGTTFKVGLIRSGTFQYANEPTIAQYSMLTPRLDIVSIGAGGGSIASIEPLTGTLRVGPQSAGAKPGPICYGAGGEEPTVTDADLLLGYLNPDYFLGGRMKLQVQKTMRIFEEKLCKALKLDPLQAAEAIYRIANSQMADLIRKVTIERGEDPREFVLFSYGGASPVHSCSYAPELQIAKTIVPATSSVYGAFGVVTSDVIHEYLLSDHLTVPAEPGRVSRIFSDLEASARDALQADGFGSKESTISRLMEIRYRRQVHQLPVPVPQKHRLNSRDLAQVYADFEQLYETTYGPGTAFREAGMEIVHFRVRAVGFARRPPFVKTIGKANGGKASASGRRKVFSEKDEAFVMTPIYDLKGFKPGNKLVGPAVIETPVTTVVVRSDQSAEMDGYRNIILTGEEN